MSANPQITPVSRLIEPLTSTEEKILSFMAQGLSDKEISLQMNIAPITIRGDHKQNIYDKLGLEKPYRSKKWALHCAYNLGLIQTVTEDMIQPLDIDNPYKGLDAFQIEDAALFFGRENFIDELLGHVQAMDKTRFLALVGASGSGKSSVIRAGLIPALIQNGVPGSSQWRMVTMLPRVNPFYELETALQRVAATEHNNILELLRRDAYGLVRVSSLLFPKDQPLLLVIDQFEELFTLVNNEQIAMDFMDTLYAAATDPQSNIRIVITLRADFLDRPLSYPDMGWLIQQNTVMMIPMRPDDVERVITLPARQMRVDFDPGVVAKLVSEFKEEPGALPLLEFALTELYDNRMGNKITAETFAAVGGVHKALASQAEKVYAMLNKPQQEVARQLFLRLITLGEGIEDVRRRVDVNELKTLDGMNTLVEPTIQFMAANRLLTLDIDPKTGQATVEVAHEALIREWERLHKWLDESRVGIRLERLLDSQVTEWEDHNRDVSFLLRGARLAQFADFRAHSGIKLTEIQNTFLDASFAEQKRQEQLEQEQQERQQKLETRARIVLRVLVVVFAVAALLSVGFGILSVIQQQETSDALDIAQKSSLAFAANSSLQTDDVDLALALVMESVGDSDAEILPETQAVLESLAYTEGPRFSLDRDFCLYMPSETVSIYLLISCDYETWTVFDPLTNTYLSKGDISPNYVPPTPSNRNFTIPQFSPDNQYFLFFPRNLNGEPVKVEVWKVDDLSLHSRFEIDKPVLGLRWSGDSSMIATIDVLPENLELLNEQETKIGHTISFWDASNGDLIREVAVDAPYYHSLNFSHDNKMGVVGGWSSFDEDKQYQITVFDIETGETLHQFERAPLYHPDYDPEGAIEVMFNPDDTVVWFGGYPGYAIDLATGENYGTLHELKLMYRLRVPNWNFIVEDAVLLMNPQQDVEFDAPNPNMRSFMLTSRPDTLIANLYGNDERYLWDLKGRGNSIVRINDKDYGFIPYAKYSPDGQYIGFVAGGPTGTANTTTIVYRADTFEEVYRLDYDLNLPFDVAWSPDSRSFATATDSEGIILWDAQTGEEIRRFTYGVEQVPFTQVEFTPDGRYLVSGQHSRAYMSDGTPYLLVWDFESGEMVKRIDLPGDSSPKYGIQWITMHPSRDMVYVTLNTTQLLVGSFTNATPDLMKGYLVDLETGQFEYMENDFLPYAAAFTPDGNELVLSAFNDNFVRVYDMQTRTFSRQWQTNQGGISGIAISPDGNLLLTNSSIFSTTPVINLWDVKTGEYIRTYSDPNLEEFLIAVDFHPDGEQFVSTDFDHAARVWNLNEQTALDWIRENRYIRELTCVERFIYRVEPLCSE